MAVVICPVPEQRVEGGEKTGKTKKTFKTRKQNREKGCCFCRSSLLSRCAYCEETKERGDVGESRTNRTLFTNTWEHACSTWGLTVKTRRQTQKTQGK